MNFDKILNPDVELERCKSLLYLLLGADVVGVAALLLAAVCSPGV